MPLTQETFAALMLEDIDGRWELHEGKLREKPLMSYGHNETVSQLVEQLLPQLPRGVYKIRQDSAQLALAGEFSYIPDLVLVPTVTAARFRSRREAFEAYVEPMPFVLEVWSPSTGSYDIAAKIPGYQRRGDAEIWHIHPLKRILTTWRRESDGTYAVQQRTAGRITLAAIPDVVIDLDELLRDDR